MATKNNKRVDEIRAELETAIAERNIDRFKTAYNVTLTKYWYLTKRERSSYYMRFLEAMHNEKNNTSCYL